MKSVLCLGSEGHIGSRLVPHLRAEGYKVSTVDTGWYYGGSPHLKLDYRLLGAPVIREFDAVVLLAAHSSVQMCENDPAGSWLNNVENFRQLLGKLSHKQILIYASSGSLLQGNTKNFSENAPFQPPLNHYDMQKQVIEMIAAKSGKRTVGLRFGTVCGSSPNPRLELMITSMFLAAQEGEIQVANPEKHRAILGMNDLTRAIQRVLEAPPEGQEVYNLCSFDSTMIDIAKRVGDYCNAPIRINSPSPTYDFSMWNFKFRDAYDYEFRDSVESICQDLEGLTHYNKSVYNRSTNLVKYE